MNTIKGYEEMEVSGLPYKIGDKVYGYTSSGKIIEGVVVQFSITVGPFQSLYVDVYTGREEKRFYLSWGCDHLFATKKEAELALEEKKKKDKEEKEKSDYKTYLELKKKFEKE